MTEYIIDSRAAGKTTALLKRMQEDERLVMVCHTQQGARAAHSLAESQGMLIDRARFMTPNEVRSQRQHHLERRYLVDNAEIVLEQLLGGSIEAITATGAAQTIAPQVDR